MGGELAKHRALRSAVAPAVVNACWAPCQCGQNILA